MAPRKTAKKDEKALPRKTTATAKKAAEKPSKVTKRAPAKKTPAPKPESPTSPMAPAKKKTAATRAKPGPKPGAKATKVAKTTKKTTAAAKKPAAAKKTAAAAEKPVEPKQTFIDSDAPVLKNLDNPKQTIEEILQEIPDRRRLTNLDRHLLRKINGVEKGEGNFGAVSEFLNEHERLFFEHGTPMHCHAKIYWRYRAVSDHESYWELDLKKLGESSTKQTAKASPRKTTGASVAQANSASPTKTTSPRARSMSPIKATATGSRGVSKSPTKSTSRARSKSPVKAAMNRPVRSPTKPTPQAANWNPAARFNADDEYGEIMRKKENSAYMVTKFGVYSDEGSLASLTAAELNALNPEDLDYCNARGVNRAQGERLADGREQYRPSRLPEVDQVDFNGLVQNHRSPIRGSQRMTRPTVSPSPKKVSPAKTSPAKTSPTKAGNRGSASSAAGCSPSKAAIRSPSKASAQSPTKGTIRSPSKAPIRASSKSPAQSPTKPDMTPLPPNQPSSEGHGTQRSPTNPEFILQNTKKNTFFETMPQKEVWHRRMPRFFTFGETPYMERIISAQIDEDLGRSHEENVAEAAKQAKSAWGKVTDTAGQVVETVSSVFSRGGSAKPSPTSPPPRQAPKDPAEGNEENMLWSMWNLPELTQAEMDQATQSQRSISRGKSPIRQ